mmetsp:Transcript_37404/g.105569  ORF Transcript_37404/g.105569 Transcript_37404/m.105569 type:complete len:284 (+) Transcript_37404:1696-2547(+)
MPQVYDGEGGGVWRDSVCSSGERDDGPHPPRPPVLQHPRQRRPPAGLPGRRQGGHHPLQRSCVQHPKHAGCAVPDNSGAGEGAGGRRTALHRPHPHHPQVPEAPAGRNPERPGRRPGRAAAPRALVAGGGRGGGAGCLQAAAPPGGQAARRQQRQRPHAGRPPSGGRPRAHGGGGRRCPGGEGGGRGEGGDVPRRLRDEFGAHAGGAAVQRGNQPRVCGQGRRGPAAAALWAAQAAAHLWLGRLHLQRATPHLPGPRAGALLPPLAPCPRGARGAGGYRAAAA